MTVRDLERLQVELIGGANSALEMCPIHHDCQREESPMGIPQMCRRAIELRGVENFRSHLAIEGKGSSEQSGRLILLPFVAPPPRSASPRFVAYEGRRSQ